MVARDGDNGFAEVGDTGGNRLLALGAKLGV
jgi:hypothetical protein